MDSSWRKKISKRRTIRAYRRHGPANDWTRSPEVKHQGYPLISKGSLNSGCTAEHASWVHATLARETHEALTSVNANTDAFARVARPCIQWRDSRTARAKRFDRWSAAAATRPASIRLHTLHPAKRCHKHVDWLSDAGTSDDQAWRACG